MTKARNKIVDLNATPFYHIICRCVRRTFLCGYDKDSGVNYSHRKRWIVARMKYLSRFFAIKIAAYAVMSNHYHMVIHIDSKEARNWSHKDLIQRVKQVFPTKGQELELAYERNPADRELKDLLKMWRYRMCDMSWFMRCMNEQIARRANLEDDCRGHFWEGRFKSQALLDEGAVLTAMAYVDLNPIRAGICATPEQSKFTSIKERIDTYSKQRKIQSFAKHAQPKSLMPLQAEPLKINLEAYLKLVDDTGRVMRSGKNGSISMHLAPILKRVGLNPNEWSELTNTLEEHYFHVIGGATKIDQINSKLNFRGKSSSQRFYLKEA